MRSCWTPLLVSSEAIYISSMAALTLPLILFFLHLATDVILKRATAIEAIVLTDHNNSMGKEYKGKIRSLYLNLKDKSNPGLRRNIVSGELAVVKFCRMTSQVGLRYSYCVFFEDYTNLSECSLVGVGNGLGRTQSSERRDPGRELPQVSRCGRAASGDRCVPVQQVQATEDALSSGADEECGRTYDGTPPCFHIVSPCSLVVVFVVVPFRPS